MESDPRLSGLSEEHTRAVATFLSSGSREGDPGSNDADSDEEDDSDSYGVLVLFTWDVTAPGGEWLAWETPADAAQSVMQHLAALGGTTVADAPQTAVRFTDIGALVSAQTAMRQHPVWLQAFGVSSTSTVSVSPARPKIAQSLVLYKEGRSFDVSRSTTQFFEL